MAARGTEHRQRVSLSACVEKRVREKHTSRTAPDVNRCFTFSGLSVWCPVGSCKSRLSCSSFRVLCITTQQAHHESLKGDPNPGLLTPSPATSSAVSPGGSCPPLSCRSGHPREIPGSCNGIPGVLGPALGFLLPCHQGLEGGGAGEGTRVRVRPAAPARKPLRFLVPTGARVTPDPGRL